MDKCNLDSFVKKIIIIMIQELILDMDILQCNHINNILKDHHNSVKVVGINDY